jgi:hypothetical protein
MKCDMLQFKEKNHIDDSDYELPLDEFLVKIHNECDPGVYGNNFSKRVIRDSNGILKYVSQTENMGDCKFKEKNTNIEKYIEIKISYLSERNNTYKLSNLRFYQNFDYFLFCFVDKLTMEYNFYLVKQKTLEECNFFKFTPVSGTILDNYKNNNIIYSSTITVTDMSWVFDKLNVLDDSTYESFLKFLKTDKDNLEIKNNDDLVMVNDISRSSATKVIFEICDSKSGMIMESINGRTNKESLYKLVMRLGPSWVRDVFPKSTWINYGATKKRVINVGGGIYLNNNMGIREIKVVTNEINNKLINYTIKLKNKLTNETI